MKGAQPDVLDEVGMVALQVGPSATNQLFLLAQEHAAIHRLLVRRTATRRIPLELGGAARFSRGGYRANRRPLLLRYGRFGDRRRLEVVATTIATRTIAHDEATERPNAETTDK